MSDSRQAIRRWLTPAQTLLLKAALLQDDSARQSWRTWRTTADLDKLDADSDRLLPLVWRNLTQLGESDPWFERLRGTYRFHWTRNQLLMAEAFKAARALQAAGIPVMLLKGFAMIVQYYRDAGLRPACDFDLMVPLAHAEQANEVLGRNGWQLNEPDHPNFASLRQCGYAAFYVNARQAALDLHWHLLFIDRRPEADLGYWEYSRTIQTAGLSVQVPSPTDLLFHICIHGAWGPATPIRWVADSVTLLRQVQAEIDWSRLVAQAQDRMLTLPLLATLSYLREEFQTPVPETVVRSLADTRHRWFEHLEFRQRSRPIQCFGYLPLHCTNYLRATRHQSWWQQAGGIPRYFQQIWSLKSSAQLPGYVAQRALQQLRKRISPAGTAAIRASA